MDILSKLFDYQKFEGNEKLAKLIEETESKYGTKLSLEDLDRVSAAGEPGSLGTTGAGVEFKPVQ